VGHVFKLGTVFSEKQGCLYLDEKGIQRPAVMGCYGIGVGRLLAAAIEQNHDEKGIVWPAPIAPYGVYLCALGMEDEEVATAADDLYRGLAGARYEVLFDDRSESAGVKFNDADLMGMPVRVVLSRRTLRSNSAEVKLRSQAEAHTIAREDVASELEKLLR
jgi:prolyl-tRNA synthetase